MKMQFSAGGVVYKKVGDQTLILVSQHSMHHGWVFPKGLIGDHIESESKESTALREVEEETGAIGKIIQALTPIDYWYFFEGEKMHKTVYYFLMEYVSGDITKHDSEMENVELLPEAEVEKRLTYKEDRNAWQEARKDLASSI
jgi:8-oxo-dGTP diphosphatase